MNKNDIKQYENVKNKVFTTSEVIQKSFVNAISELDKSDYVIIENQRQKITMVLQDIQTFTGVQHSSKSFSGKVTTPAENMLLAKTFIRENTFYLMRFESENITFPDVEDYLEPGLTKNGFDRQITGQLIQGWKYVISNVKPFNFNMFLAINGIVAKEQALEWGVLRTGNVSISGTDHIPNVQSKTSIDKLISDFTKSSNKYIGAATLLVKLIKTQPFWDGNKRTAFLSVNKLLIENSLGVLTLKVKDFHEFNRLLSHYYNDESTLGVLTNFIVDNCFYNTLEKKLK